MRLFTILGLFCASLLFLTLVAGLVYSSVKAGPDAVLSAFGAVWDPQGGRYGLMPMAAGSLLTASLATLAAIPLSFGILSFMWVFDNAAGRFMRGLVRFMSGIPTVVYGFCGLFLLVPLFRSVWGGGGFSIITVSAVLCIVVLPTMTVVADSALSPLLSGSRGLMLTAASLGVSREKAFLHIALATQKKILVTAVLLTFSRALGDTLIALMLSGNTPVMPDGFLSSVRTLSAHISLLTATEITPGIEFTLFFSGSLLSAAALGLSFAARRLRKDD